jgi:hypothetical protein
MTATMGLDEVAALLAAGGDAADREVRTIYLARARARLAQERERLGELARLLDAAEIELVRLAESERV